jgi:hypothetical protein
MTQPAYQYFEISRFCTDGKISVRIKLKLEIEEKGEIAFLEVKIKRNEEERKVQTEWHQKNEHAGIYCNIKSDVDEGTKRNLVKNLEKR